MHLKQNLNKNLKNLCIQKRKSIMHHQVISFMLMTIIFSQIILTSATDLNTANIMDSKKDLDCIRLQFFLKSLILRIQRLELSLLQKMNNFAKLPYELAEIESLCASNGQIQPEILKRNFDEIDRSGFRGFSKKNFDEIDKVGFRNFMGR